MVRGILGPMEKHHKVRISDAAIVAAVQLSHRYIPARQLPDKAVSLLDTAAARVSISQSATPAMIEDTRASIAAREAEKAGLLADSDLGHQDDDRLAAIDADIVSLRETLANLETEWDTEQKLVTEIRSLREILTPDEAKDKAAVAARLPQSDEVAVADKPTATNGGGPQPTPAEARAQVREKFDALEERDPEKRMIYAHVDEQAVASVVSD